MNFKAITLAVLMAAGTTYAYAEPGGEGNNTNCNGVGNPNSPCEGIGGQGGTATGVNTNENTNTNSSNSTSQANAESASAANSSSNSTSSSNSSGGNVRSNIDVQGGQSFSGSSSVSGDSYANTGDSTSSAASGDSTAVAEGGDGGKSSSGGNSLSTSYVDESSAASAASVFAGYCQTGGSAQTGAGGFSVVNPEQFCNHIRMAAVYQEAFQFEMKHGSAMCSAAASSEWPDSQYEDHCVNEQAGEYLSLYREHIALADDQLAATKVVSKVDAFFGYLVRPLGVLALLILL